MLFMECCVRKRPRVLGLSIGAARGGNNVVHQARVCVTMCGARVGRLQRVRGTGATRGWGLGARGWGLGAGGLARWVHTRGVRSNQL